MIFGTFIKKSNYNRTCYRLLSTIMPESFLRQAVLNFPLTIIKLNAIAASARTGCINPTTATGKYIAVKGKILNEFLRNN